MNKRFLSGLAAFTFALTLGAGSEGVPGFVAALGIDTAVRASADDWDDDDDSFSFDDSEPENNESSFSYYVHEDDSFDDDDTLSEDFDEDFDDDEPFYIGDLNDSGSKPDVDDLVLMQKAVAGWKVNYNKDKADLNNDNNVDVDDLVIMQKYVAGWKINFIKETGKCGDNVTWSLDDEGTLTIKGTGATWDDECGSWFGNTDGIKKVIIEDGVTSIGTCLFEFCKNLTSASVPKTVTNIESSAFSYCKSLTNVTIQEGVKEIGSYAFMDCQNLKSVTIPASVNSIGDYAFGYYYDKGYQQVEGFKIYCYPRTGGIYYACYKNFDYECLQRSDLIETDGLLYEVRKSDDGNEYAYLMGCAKKCEEITVRSEINGLEVSGFDYDICSHYEYADYYSLLEHPELKKITFPYELCNSDDDGIVYKLAGILSDYVCQQFSNQGMNITICAPENSYAELMCLRNGTKFESTGEYLPNQFGVSLVTLENEDGDKQQYYYVDKYAGTENLKNPDKFIEIPDSINGIPVERIVLNELINVRIVYANGKMDNASLDFDHSLKKVRFRGIDYDLDNKKITIDGNNKTVPKEYGSIGTALGLYENVVFEEGVEEICGLNNYALIFNLDNYEDYASLSTNLMVNVKQITLPSTLKKIDSCAFLSDHSNVAFRESYNLWGYVSTVVPQTSTSFYGEYLKEITIPKFVTEIGDHALGYAIEVNPENYSSYEGILVKIPDFKIYGYTGTAAETYANENGFEFISLDNSPK